MKKCIYFEHYGACQYSITPFHCENGICSETDEDGFIRTDILICPQCGKIYNDLENERLLGDLAFCSDTCVNDFITNHPI